MKNLILILSILFTVHSSAQDLRDELVGEYVGYIIKRGQGTGNVIDTLYKNWKYYLIKSSISDSLYLKKESPNNTQKGKYVVHPDTSFSGHYSDNGKPYPKNSYHGYKLSPDSLYYQRNAPGGGSSEPVTIEFYGKKTDWIGIDENKLVDEISLYPNPFNHELNIKSTQEIKQVLVRNLEGKTQLSLSPKQKAFKLPLSQLNKGVYFIELHTGNGIVLKKVLKK